MLGGSEIWTHYLYIRGPMYYPLHHDADAETWNLLVVVLGTIHKGRPADPGEGGSPKTGHLLLFVKKFYCLTRTHGGGGVRKSWFWPDVLYVWPLTFTGILLEKWPFWQKFLSDLRHEIKKRKTLSTRKFGEWEWDLILYITFIFGHFIAEKSLRHRVFPGGPPSKYYPGPTMLTFRDQTRTVVFIVVWS